MSAIRGSKSDFSRALLHFVDFHSADFPLSFGRVLGEGVATVVPLGSRAGLADVPERLRERFEDRIRICGTDRMPKVSHHSAVAPNEAAEVFLLLEPDPDRLSTLLHEFVDRPAVLFAPRTERFRCGRGLFVVTIPKAGTHLVFHMLKEFQLHGAGRFEGDLEPHAWYFLLGNNCHVTAPAFFGEIGRLDGGGYEHPLFRTPVLFLYRNPLDILVSEAMYLGGNGTSGINHYLRAIPASRRLDELISTPLLGDFDARILAFAPWLELPNVIPVSFEELVGPQGGGTREAQLRVIWSLQLRLHVPGPPTYFGEVAFYRVTPTFRRGAINGHKQHLRARHLRRLAEFKQDFMTRFGYDMNDEYRAGYLPRFAERFRRRPLVLGPPAASAPEAREIGASADATHPVYAFRGYLLGALAGCYYAIPRALAPLNPILDWAIPHLHGAYSLEELRANVELDPLDPTEDFAPLPGAGPDVMFDLAMPQLVVEGYKGFNIVRRGDRIFTEAQWGATNAVAFSSIDSARATIDRWVRLRSLNPRTLLRSLVRS